MTDSREFLYVIRATRPEMVTVGPNPEEEEILTLHARHLSRLTNEGTVLVFGRTQNTDESNFGVVIFQAEDEEEARLLMQSDPAVAYGIMQAELYPYRVAGLAGSWR